MKIKWRLRTYHPNSYCVKQNMPIDSSSGLNWLGRERSRGLIGRHGVGTLHRRLWPVKPAPEWALVRRRRAQAILAFRGISRRCFSTAALRGRSWDCETTIGSHVLQERGKGSYENKTTPIYSDTYFVMVILIFNY